MKSVFGPLLMAFLTTTILPAQDPAYFLWRDTFCSNQLVLVNNNFYGPDNPAGTEILPGAASNGADSVIQIDFYFFAPVIRTVQEDLCRGDTLWFNNSPYHAMRWLGEEVISDGSTNGCDSIIKISLTVLNVPELVLRDTLPFDSFVIVNGRRYDRMQPNGTEILPGGAINGCDSVVMIDLAFRDQQLSNRIYIPNVFDPGAPSPNNRFFIQATQDLRQIRQLLIVDRWGDLVYFREDIAPNAPDEGWDGTARNGAAAPQGVYAYKARLEMLDGRFVDRSGDVTLLRRQ